MLRRLSVRGKILATLAVPVIVLIVAATLIAAEAVATALVGAQTKSIAETTSLHDTLMTALQGEYTITLNAAEARDDESEGQLAAARGATDTARAEYLAAARDIDLDQYSTNVATAWRAAERSLVDLDGDRQSLDAAVSNTANIIAFPVIRATYNGLIENQTTFYTTLTDALENRDVARSVGLYADTFVLRADYSQELRAATSLVLDSSAVTDASQANAASTIQATDAALSVVSQELSNLKLSAIDTPSFTLNVGVSRAAILAGRADANITAAARSGWLAETNAYAAELTVLQADVRDHVVAKTSAASNAAWTQAWITIIVAVLAVMLSVLFALLIARRITRPLAMLTAAAGNVRDELPKLVEQVAVPGETPTMSIEPIKIESQDEIGQLAAAFNDVNDTTLSVAREQAALRGSIAEMFVNVARRDHALLNRQLSFLDDLERTEEDPTTLSNLFRLDHLATRMRRNSESLLVLAGIDSGRRVREGMPLSDVVRTASSEIESYDRIVLTLLDDPTMLGHTALNAAHLLAELLENATMFSDPTSQVEVTTTSDKLYVSVVVRDRGLGMTPEELHSANSKLASSAASDVVGSQRLGLFVVGRIADRLGAHVRFDAAADGGTIVSTAFPRSLFVDQGLAREGDEQTDWQRGAAAPEVAEPVDIGALTDGATTTGMPRRRASAPTPDASAPSEYVGRNEDDIVLPPLATPMGTGMEMGAAAAEDVWQPLAVDADGGNSLDGFAQRSAGLPSRSPAPAAEFSAIEEHTAPLPTEERSAIFSSFRPREALDGELERMDAGNTGAQEIVPPPMVVPGFAPTSTGEQPVVRESAFAAAAEPAAVEPEYVAPEYVAPEAEAPQYAEPQYVEPEQAIAAEQPEPSVPAAESFEPVADAEPEYEAPPARRLPRHAAPEDLERLKQEYLEHEAAVAAEEAVEVAEPVVGEDATFADDDYTAVPAAATEQPVESDGQPWAQTPELEADDWVAEPAPEVFTVPGLAPDDGEDSGDGDDAAQGAVQVESDPVAVDAPALEEPAVTEAASGLTYGDTGEVSALVSPAVDPASDSFTPAAPAEPPVAGSLPKFADVISDEPGPDASGEDSAPRKKGRLGRFFGRKAAEPEAPSKPTMAFPPVVSSAAVPSTPAPVAPPPTAPSVPVPSDTWSAPAAPAPMAWSAPEPVTAPAPEVEDSWSPPVPSGAPAEGTGWSPGGLAPRTPGATDAGAAGRATGPVQPKPAGASSWSPDGPGNALSGSMTPELAAMLASRADIQEQAFSELSQLSTYRPAAVQDQAADGLVRRQRGEVAAPVEDPSTQKISRDASLLRSRLSAFQSGTVKGRQATGEDGVAADSSVDSDAASDTAISPR